MSAARAFLRRVAGLFARARRDRELDAELEAHLALHVDDNIRAGMSPEDARRTALLHLGGLAQTKESVRDRRGLPLLETLAQDVRYGLRTLRKSPTFTVVAVATLALGIGANSAVFSVVNAVLLRRLPFRDPDRIVAFTDNQSLPDLEDIVPRSRSLALIGGVNNRALDYTGGERPIQVAASVCTLRYFDVFGVRAERGRLIEPEDDLQKSGRVAVVSHAFWTDHLGSDPDVIGRTIPLSGDSYTIVGVMPASVRLPGRAADVWASLRVIDKIPPDGTGFRDVHYVHSYARLKPGVTLAQAQSEMTSIDRWLEKAYPESSLGRRRTLKPLREFLVADSRRALLVLFGAVGLVLLIACANFASLLLARGSVRQRELVIRGALGAGRWRLVRQMLTESVLLSLLGGAAGLGLARFGVRALVALRVGGEGGILPIRIDAAVFAFTATAAAATGLVFGLIPALTAAKLDLQKGLHDFTRGQSASRGDLRLRRILVVSEIAFALVLLAGAGLLIRSFEKLRSVEPGFRADHVLTMRLELPEARYEKIPQQRLFRARLLETLNALPGVDAALVSELPMSGEDLTHNFLIEGRPPIPVGAEPEVLTRTVSPGYFRVLGIPLHAGRGFGDQDDADTPLVALVNESLVRKYFPNGGAVGTRVRWSHDDSPHWMTIVGVVGDVNHFGPGRPEEPAVYDLYTQFRQPWKRWMYVVVRSSIEPAALVRAVTGGIWRLDSQLPPTKVRRMREVVAGSTAEQKFNAILLGLFAALALLLASIGVYGLMSYSVARQRHDIGVRMALGADASAIARMIVGDGARLAAAGVTIGLAGALLLTRLMASLLFGVGARDPATLIVGIALLGAVAVVASWIPARWATRVNPVVALRVE